MESLNTYPNPQMIAESRTVENSAFQKIAPLKPRNEDLNTVSRLFKDDPNFKDSFIEQTLASSVTVAAGATDQISITIPTRATAYLMGYGYTFGNSTSYTLQVGHTSFPARSDQEGSILYPKMFLVPFKIDGGKSISLVVTNSSSESRTYFARFIVLTSQVIQHNSTGGELIQSEAPTVLLSGSKATTTASAESLASSAKVNSVIIQVATGSSDVLIGNVSDQSVRLVATQSIQIHIDDISKIYIKRVTTDPTVNYIAT